MGTTKEKVSHTPGPWEIDPYSDETIAIHSPNGDLHVCTLEEREDENEQDLPNECCREADAYLIAAAPDLLAACEKVVAELHIRNDFAPLGTLGFASDLLNAINKAKGL